MEAYLDSQPLDCPAACTLEQVLAVAGPMASTRQRMIVEVRLDGVVISGADLDARLQTPLGDEQVELLSAAPIALAVTAVDDAIDALAQTRSLQKQAAGQLAADQAAGAMPAIRDLMNIWQQVHLALQQVLQVGQAAGIQVSADDPAIKQAVAVLAQNLNAIRDHLSSANWLGLADVFNYELGGTADLWDQALNELRTRMREHMKSQPEA